MSLFLVILAAGNSKRLKSNIPKPFQIVNGKSIIEHNINSFKNFKEIKKIVIVYNKKHKKNLNYLKLKKITKVVGGKTRQESTLLALRKINRMKCSKILIHDCARPIPSRNLIKKIINKLKMNDGVVPTIKVNDAVKRIKGKTIFKNIDRKTLRFSQTPQGFSFRKIYNQHLKNKNKNFDDDSALFTNSNDKILSIDGEKSNLKVTDKEDLKILKSIKKINIFYGIGFDVHRLVKNKPLYLGGVKIPFKLGLKGHSDGDPVIHAIIDALLGACRLGNIGKLFSDKNKKYKNIRSTILLKKTIKFIKSKKFHINNIDINIITEKPKINNYSKKMIKTISKICEINYNRVNIKGKTTEKLGLIGKEKAIASEVIISVKQND